MPARLLLQLILAFAGVSSARALAVQAPLPHRVADYGYRYYDAGSGRWTSRDPIEEQGGLNQYAIVANDLIDTVDHIGLLDQYTLLFTTAIRPPDIESGEKSSHRITFDESGKVITHWEYIGLTPRPFAIGGGGEITPATISGSHPIYTVHMKGSVYAKPLRWSGWVLPPIPFGPMGPFITHNLVIDYDLEIKMDVCQRTGDISGNHDGYPSYTLRVGGLGVVYDFQQVANRLDRLFPPMEVSVNQSLKW